LPAGRDADGHDAKHGYGRIQAVHTCIAARDPIAMELVAMGEIEGARAWMDVEGGYGAPYSSSFARWAVRALLADPTAEHALRVVLRHMRLSAKDERRFEAHPPGSVARQIALLLRKMTSSPVEAPTLVQMELSSLEQSVRNASSDAASFEARLLERAKQVLAREHCPSRSTPLDASTAEESLLRRVDERRP
jgi:hypothetical protein